MRTITIFSVYFSVPKESAKKHFIIWDGGKETAWTKTPVVYLLTA